MRIVVAAVLATYGGAFQSLYRPMRSLESVQRRLLQQPTALNEATREEKPTTVVASNYLKRQNQKLSQLGKSKDFEDAERVMRLLIDKGIQPDVSSYHFLLDSYGESKNAKRAEEVLEILESVHHHRGTIAYNLALKILRNNSKRELGRAERIWNKAIDHGVADEITYATFAGILANQETEESAQRILDIAGSPETIPEKLAINTQTWNNAMIAFVRGGDMQQAERILQLLEASWENGKLAPTVASYSIVIDGWAKQNNVDKAQQAFDRMQTMYQSHGNEDARPNAYPYVTLIHMYARQRGSAECAAKAEAILFDMHKSFQSGNESLKPNTQLITSCIDAWQRSGASNCGERGEALLDWMVEQSRTDDDFAPNTFTFCSAITAWAKSRQLGKASRARLLLNRMIQLHSDGQPNVHPDSVAYTAVINACAHCLKDDSEIATSLRIAVATYRELQQKSDAQPTEITYFTFLVALQNLVPVGPKRTQAAFDVFQKAMDCGYVNHRVVSRIKSCAPREALVDVLPEKLLLSTTHIDDTDIPLEWRRNVED